MGIFLLSSSIYSQQLGFISVGNHSIALHKANGKFACVYSDINGHILYPKKAFVFPNKETLHAIIVDGFKNKVANLFGLSLNRREKRSEYRDFHKKKLFITYV